VVASMFALISWRAFFWSAIFGTCIHEGETAVAGIKNGVYELDPNNFNDTIKHFPHVMVQFYAPWCGHCQAMAPAFGIAGMRLIEEGDELSPRLARVDVTRYPELAKLSQAVGIPTLIVFSHGDYFSEYYGARESGDFVRYMQSLDMPLYLGGIYRSYFILRGVYREILQELLPPISPQTLDFLTLLFPILAFGPLVLMAIGCVFVYAATEDPDPSSEDEAGDAGDPNNEEKEQAHAGEKASEKAENAEGERPKAVKKRRSKKMD